MCDKMYYDGIVTEPSVLSSPFIDLQSQITEYELIKMVALFPLAVARALVTSVLFLTMYGLVLFETAYGVNCEVVVHHVLRASVVASGCWVTTKGIKNRERCVGGPYVMVYNHVSFMDSFVLAVSGFVAGVTGRHYLEVPVVGACFAWLGTIFFVPGEGASTLITKRLQEGGRFPLAIAPEGALTNGRALLKFKTGAFVAMVPVLPVLIRYPSKYFTPAWTIVDPFFTAYRYLTQVVNHATVEYLPIMYPLEEDTPNTFSQRVRAVMAEELGVPMVEQDVTDKIAFSKKYRLSPFHDFVVSKCG